MRIVRGLAALVVVFAALTAAGCAGNGTPGIEALWPKVKDQFTNAKSVHMKGTVTDAGKSIKIDLAGVRDGSNQKLIMGVDGGTAEIISVDKMMYVKGDMTFWKNNGVSQMTPEIAAKYVSQPAASDASEMSVGSVLTEMAKSSLNLVDLVNLQVEPTTLDGKKAYVVTERVATKYANKLWISADENPVLLAVEGKDDSGQPQQLSFSEWNSVAPFTAPSKDQVFSK